MGSLCSNWLPVFTDLETDLPALFTPCPEEAADRSAHCTDCITALANGKERVVLLELKDKP